MEMRQPNPSEKDISAEDSLDFSRETDPNATQISLANEPVAELLIGNRAIKYEKAERVLGKIKKSLEVAEANLAEELKNELRHEHKDSSASQPVPISTVIADTSARQGLPVASSTLPPSEEETEEMRNTDYKRAISTKDISLYRQAIIAGFSAAAILLIFFALFLVF